MNDERIAKCRLVLYSHARELERHLENPDADVATLARVCQQIGGLVLAEMNAPKDGEVPETWAAWLLTGKPEGEAAA
jgi:ubiquinone/menaquinone biosynthesis C-methylase UbiE